VAQAYVCGSGAAGLGLRGAAAADCTCSCVEWGARDGAQVHGLNVAYI